MLTQISANPSGLIEMPIEWLGVLDTVREQHAPLELSDLIPKTVEVIYSVSMKSIKFSSVSLEPIGIINNKFVTIQKVQTAMGKI